MTPACDFDLWAGNIEGALKETAAALSLFPINLAGQAFTVNGGAPLQADGDDTFYSKRKVTHLLGTLHGHLKGIEASLNAARAQAKPPVIPRPRIEQLATDLRAALKPEDSLRVVAGLLCEIAQKLAAEGPSR